MHCCLQRKPRPLPRPALRTAHLPTWPSARPRARLRTLPKKNTAKNHGFSTTESCPPACLAPQEEPPAELSTEEKAAAEAKAAALKEKELGNEAYKKKAFEEAVSHYNK